MVIFSMSECNTAQMLGEVSRFMFHITFLHLISLIINGESFFKDGYWKALMITVISVMCYHLLARKAVEPHLKKMKIICKKDKENNIKHIYEQKYQRDIREKREYDTARERPW